MNRKQAEAMLDSTVMSMAEGIPQDVSSAELGKELLDTLRSDGTRDEQKQLTMLASALASALKIINRSNLNTPTTEKEDNR